MIVIEVTNSREVVRQRVGRLGERLIGTVVDAEAQVENALLQELQQHFRELGTAAKASAKAKSAATDADGEPKKKKISRAVYQEKDLQNKMSRRRAQE